MEFPSFTNQDFFLFGICYVIMNQGIFSGSPEEKGWRFIHSGLVQVISNAVTGAMMASKYCLGYSPSLRDDATQREWFMRCMSQTHLHDPKLDDGTWIYPKVLLYTCSKKIFVESEIELAFLWWWIKPTIINWILVTFHYTGWFS